MVLRKNYQQVLEQSLIIGLFILANVSAFLTYIWLIPGILIIELVLWLILAALCAWFLYKHKFVTSFLKNLQKSWFIIPFLIFSGFSIFWSINWDVSLSRWLIFLFTIIAAGYIGLRYRIGEIIKLLSVFGIYILLISSALIYFVPRIGVMNYHIIQGAWKGLYWHKNHMGFIAVFISALFLMNMIYCIQNKEKDSFLWGILY